MDSEKTYPDIISYFKEYNGDYFNEVIQHNKNEEYKAAVKEMSEKSDVIHDLLLAEDSPVQDFANSIHHTSWLESEMLYLRGLRDGVAVLRLMGLLV